MRPLKLTMEAFGPFARRQELDFQRLAGYSPFLIQGPTGAGKTSILDAICFALYGASSGGEREAKGLRCDFAPPETATAVTLDWALGERRYRVWRAPEQRRPKKRGGGFTSQAAEATIWRLDDGPARVLASGWSPVSEQCQTLLGFSQEQFRQVVVLPQGQFRRLLTADSRERERVLETLFQTNFYRLLTEALKERAKGLEKGIGELRQKSQAIVEQAGVADAAGLDQELARLDAQQAQARHDTLALRQTAEDARQALGLGQRASAALDELAQAQSATDALAAQAPEMARQRQALDLARRAAALADVDAHRQKAAAEATRATEALALREAQQAQANQAWQAAESALAAESGRDDQRRQARALVERLAGLAGVVRAMERAAADQARLAHAATSAQATQDQAAATVTALRTEAGQAAQAVEAARALAAQATGLESLARQARQAQDAAEALAKLTLELPAARQRADQAGQAVELAVATVTMAQSEHQHLLRLWRDGQAAALAAGLSPDAPCPVCGSLSHPAPALDGPRAPEQARLDQAQRTLEQARQALDERRQAQTKADAAVADLLRRQDELRAALGPDAQTPAVDLTARAKQAGRSLAQAQKAQTALPGLEAALAARQARLAQAEADAQAAAMAAQDAARQLAAQTAVTAERLAQVPAELRPPGALNQALDLARRELASLEQALVEAQQNQASAAQANAAASAALAAARAAEAQARDEATASQRQWQERLTAAGFADEALMRAAARDQAAIEALDGRLQRHAADLAAAGQRLERAKLAAAGLATPDLAALQQAVAVAQARLEEATDLAGQLAERLRQAQAWRGELQRMAGRLTELDAGYGVVGRVAEVAGGQNPLGVTLQRFVLAALLDEVLEAASARLALMSRGRYLLLRDTQRADQRRAGGLDLLIHDDHHGTQRPVQTLSGGESFLASLALALGLAEVVQAHAGGIQLETIFVDEGFGSLDAEALDLALAALMDLRAGGRLVGIISHVEELKERIDARLEVIPGRQGSTARIVV